jgi:uncharacterized protein (TIGR02118 family)
MIVTVLYPKTERSTFDHAYYMAKHVPLVASRWTAHGLTSTRVMQGTGSLGGAPAFELMTLMEFPSREAFLAAAGAHADEIMGDIKNFTNVEPIVQFNEWA